MVEAHFELTFLIYKILPIEC